MSRPGSDIAFLARALKAPRIAARAEPLAKRAVEESWDHETYLAAVLSEEVSARETHGGEHRVKAARFPQTKTLDDFDFSFQRSVKKSTMAHLSQLDFLHEAKNVIFLGPPGTGKTHLSIALGVQAARRGHRVAFASAQDWVGRLATAETQRQTRGGTRTAAPDPARHRRRGRLHPLRSRRRRSVLRLHRLPLRTGQPRR